MKLWISRLLLPLVFLQTPGLAQQTPPAPVTPNFQLLKEIDPIRLQLVNCSDGLDCFLAKLLLPANANINQQELAFDNITPAPVTIVNTAIALRGGLTGYQIVNITPQPASTEKPPELALAFPQNTPSLPANKISSFPLIINRSLIPPDQYTGTIYLTMKDRSDRLSLPITLNSRRGPLAPLAVLFFGVVLGRLLQYMQKRGEPQSKALEEVYCLQADIARANLEDRDKQSLAEMASDVRNQVDQEKLETYQAEIKTIRDRLETLVKLETIENQLVEQAQSFPTDVDTFTVKIRKARLYIAQKEDDKAKKLLDEIRADFDSIALRSGSTAGNTVGIDAIKRSIDEATSATVSMDKATLTIKQQNKPLNNFQKALITLSGVSSQVRVETTFWVVRPLLSLILLVGLSAIGMGSLYIENGTTFGAKPLSDFLGLILWGLSADVASRSLSNLKGDN